MGTEIAAMHENIDALRNEMTKCLSDAVARRVYDMMRENYVVEGAVPVSTGDLEKLRVELIGEIRNRTSIVQPPENETPSNEQHQAQQWMSWNWEDGKIFHTVPLGWEFPVRVNVKKMWDLWYLGDKSTGIRPYRLISKDHDVHKTHRMRHRRVCAVMEALKDIATSSGLLPTEESMAPTPQRISAMSVKKSDAVFTHCYTVLLGQLYPTTKARRKEELSCGTVYNKLIEYRSNMNTESAEDA